MKTLRRWLCFNAVGAVGMAAQLAAVSAIDRLYPGHARLATVAALELVLLHNFVGHVRFTWRDRRAGARLGCWLGRFHVTNGAVSLAGNLLMVRLLTEGVGVPVAAANLVGIALCSLVNYGLGDGWVFAAGGPLHERRGL